MIGSTGIFCPRTSEANGQKRRREITCDKKRAVGDVSVFAVRLFAALTLFPLHTHAEKSLLELNDLAHTVFSLFYYQCTSGEGGRKTRKEKEAFPIQ